MRFFLLGLCVLTPLSLAQAQDHVSSVQTSFGPWSVVRSSLPSGDKDGGQCLLSTTLPSGRVFGIALRMFEGNSVFMKDAAWSSHSEGDYVERLSLPQGSVVLRGHLKQDMWSSSLDENGQSFGLMMDALRTNMNPIHVEDDHQLGGAQGFLQDPRGLSRAIPAFQSCSSSLVSRFLPAVH